MANYQWPTSYLPPWSIRGALNPKPPKVLARTDMEGPRPRVRRRFSGGLWAYPVQWVFSQAQFKLFQAIYADKDALNEGANWFDSPIFHGEAYAAAACRFLDQYDPRLRGVEWWVSATLEVDGLAVLTKAEVNARWPGAIP